MSLNSYTWHAAAEVFCTADGKRLHPSHGSVFYRKEEIDAALAAERQANTELAMRERKAEADLADANHALILANNNANAFRRVAEQRQAEIERLRRAVEWCLTYGAKRDTVLDVSANEYVDGIRNAGCNCCSITLEVPAEFADIIKPIAGARK